MNASTFQPLATGFAYGNALLLFWAAVFIVHGVSTFILLYIYQKRGGDGGAITFTVAVVTTLGLYLMLGWGCSFDLSELFARLGEMGSEFPLGTLAMISPLSVLFMPIAIFLRARNRAVDGPDEAPKDQSK